METLNQIELFTQQDAENKKKVTLFAVERYNPLSRGQGDNITAEKFVDYQLIIVDPYMTLNISFTAEMLINLQHAISHNLKKQQL